MFSIPALMAAYPWLIGLKTMYGGALLGYAINLIGAMSEM